MDPNYQNYCFDEGKWIDLIGRKGSAKTMIMVRNTARTIDLYIRDEFMMVALDAGIFSRDVIAESLYIHYSDQPRLPLRVETYS